MKAAENKTTVTAQRSQSRAGGSHHVPFFERSGEGAATVARGASFFSPGGGDTIQRKPFFVSGSFVQPRLRVGQPGDRYEQEADRTADKVVQRLAEGRGRSGADTGASKAIQRKPIFESDEELQKMEEPGEEETLQRKPIFESAAPPDEDAVQRQGSSGGEGDSTSASPSLESRLQSSSGGGDALPEETRGQMEDAIGADFGGVRVHTGSEAAGMNKELGAQAFTHGSDVYFGEGNYRPGSSEGDHLVAHELTHTIQQGGAARAKRIDRETSGGAEGDGAAAAQKVFEVTRGDYAKTKLDITNRSDKILVIDGPSLRLPKFKSRNKSLFDDPSNFDAEFAPSEGRRLRVRNTGQRGKTDQVKKWESAVAGDVTSNMAPKFAEARKAPSVSEDESVYYFALKATRSTALVFGTKEHIEERLARPFYDQKGRPRNMQVDHVVERQVGGADETNNYELLESSANASSGSKLAAEINQKIKGARSALDQAHKGVLIPKKGFTFQRLLGNVQTIRKGYRIYFAKPPKYRLGTTGSGNSYWSRAGMKAGKPFELLRPLNNKELEALNDKTKKTIFLGPVGGVRKILPEREKIPSGGAKLLGHNVDRVRLIDYDWDAGLMEVEVFKRKGKKNILYTDSDTKKKGKKHPWRLKPIPGLNAKALDKGSVQGGAINSLRLPGLSPIRMDTLDVVDGVGLVGKGKLLPTLPLVKDADIDIVIHGDEVRLQKTFDVGEIKVPPPFKIPDSSLTVFYGTGGLGVKGNIGLVIDRVGEGELSAKASTGGGFELQGRFNFDSKLFSKAEVKAAYKDKAWSFEGTLGIDKGKIAGVNSAQITVGYANDTLSAQGQAELGVPGVESGALSMVMGPEGFTLGGNFKLRPDIPGIKSGSVNATLSRSAETGEWGVSAGGKAVPAIPGIDTELSVQYDNGIVTIIGLAKYQRGLLSGWVRAGATNRAVGEDGKPTGAPAEKFRAFGAGALTIRLTPWLAATAGVKFLDNGEMEVQGRLGIPSKVTVFKRLPFKHPLLTPPSIQIPIFAIPLGPKSIGIVAEISGSLNFEAGFGPGELRKLEAEITYNPDHEDQTVIAGRGEFVVPADAGLVLRADLGLGASAGIASLTGGLGLMGRLGLKAEASAAAEINWSPGKGVVLDAEAKAEVQPQFEFSINAFVRGKIDLYVKSFSKTWRKRLAGFSWGPGFNFGVRFPVHYEEGKPFNMSFSDIKLTYPRLNIIDMAKRIARDVKKKLF